VKEKKYQNNRNEKKAGAKYTISKGLARAKCVIFSLFSHLHRIFCC